MIERYCNNFAGEFLVPNEDYDLSINGKFFSEALVEQLSSKYCVSREVIIRRFLDKEYIGHGEYSSLREEYLNDYFRYVETKSVNK